MLKELAPTSRPRPHEKRRATSILILESTHLYDFFYLQETTQQNESCWYLVGSLVAKQQGQERCGFWRDAAAIPMRMMRFSPLVAHFIRRRNSAKRSSLETSSKLAIASLALSLDCCCSLRNQIESKAWESFSHLSRFRDCVLLAPLTTSSPCSPSRSRHGNRELITGN